MSEREQVPVPAHTSHVPAVTDGRERQQACQADAGTVPVFGHPALIVCRRAVRYFGITAYPPGMKTIREKGDMKKIAVVAALVALSGCATITSSEMQTVSLTASGPDGQAVADAKCELQNDKGKWQAATPSQIAVRRSADDLTITCKKEGMADGLLRAISRAAGSMFGNILLGGGVGALIDHNKGTGYNYPDNLPVKMGQSTTVDRREQDQPAQTAASQ